jgi:hypothetical protein
VGCGAWIGSHSQFVINIVLVFSLAFSPFLKNGG